MKLYYSPTSPYVRKVQVTAIELGLALELEPVAVHAFPSDYGRVNPVNRIPALELDDGELVFDSRVICEYLITGQGSDLLPASGPERWRVLKLQVLGDGLMDAAVPKMGEVSRPPDRRWQPRLDEYDRSLRQTLDALEGLAAAKAGQNLDGLNLGVIAIACGLGYLDLRFAAEPWRDGRPALTAWFGAFSRRPSMVTTFPVAPKV
jgi:glutathione S-transferase